MSVRFSSISIICLALLAAGCGGDDEFKKARPKTVNATGTIFYNGEPLAGATILLEPSNPDGRAAISRSGKNGEFSPDAFPPDPGAVPGTYRVSVTKRVPSAQQTLSEDSHDVDVVEGEDPDSLIPPQYSNAKTSGLTIEVPESGSDSLKIELK